MKPKLTIVLVAMVLLPIGTLGWLGARLARAERADLRRRFIIVAESRLADAATAVGDYLDELERHLAVQIEAVTRDGADLRAIANTDPNIRWVFRLDPEGELTDPRPKTPSPSSEERDFLERTATLWREGELFHRTQHALDDATSSQSSPQRWGWHTWYWGPGLQIVYWARLNDGGVVGVEVDRVRLMAELIERLPETDPADPRLPDGRVTLHDAGGRTLYQWGAYEPADPDAPPEAVRDLAEPLAAWRLTYHASPEVFAAVRGRGRGLARLLALGAVALALGGLAVFFHRESTRDLRDAARRVTFVNQVSHELKTPLTNIRMYGELLEEAILEEDEKPRRYAAIIVAESRRLSRLIGNVLTFGRQRRGPLRVRPTPHHVDESVAAVLAKFEPSLQARGIQTHWHPGADRVVSFDADALEQILANLLSNAEKYAASGGRVDVTTAIDDDTLEVLVADQGPGIPVDQRERVFEAFHRVSDRLSDGVAGAGIGLTIARELARAHGGELELLPSRTGAQFRLRLRCRREHTGEHQT